MLPHQDVRRNRITDGSSSSNAVLQRALIKKKVFVLGIIYSRVTVAARENMLLPMPLIHSKIQEASVASD
jgi:hypothetical protein